MESEIASFFQWRKATIEKKTFGFKQQYWFKVLVIYRMYECMYMYIEKFYYLVLASNEKNEKKALKIFLLT